MFAIMQIILTKKRYLSLDIFLIIDTLYALKFFGVTYIQHRVHSFIVLDQLCYYLPYRGIALIRP